MQLKKLYIKEYKILKDFTFEFPYDFQKYISVLIGVNGSGKSTVLEAIAEIFSFVVLDQKAKFAFSLEYSVRHEEILLDSSTWRDSKTTYFVVKIEAKQKDEKPKLTVYLPDGTILNSLSEINGNKPLSQLKSHLPSNLYKVLPDNIVIYYSGLSDIMKQICEPHNDKLSENYRKGIANIPQLFFYYEPQLFNLLLISLLSYEFGDVPIFLKEKANITGFQSIIIRLKRPKWATGKKAKDFWGATGEVKAFLEYLDSIGNPLVIDENYKPKGRPGNVVGEIFQDEFINITIIGEKLFEIREHYVEERRLFKLLKTLYFDGFLYDVEFNLYKEKDGRPESFSILSEGEQQALTIKGLTELVSEENSLFLLDEPDTYLHPEWQRDFINGIDNFCNENIEKETSFIISTHSPNLVSGISKSQLLALKNGKKVDIAFDPYGKPIDSILIDFFSVEGLRNIIVENEIKKLRNLVMSDKYDTSEFTEILTKLEKQIGKSDKDIIAIKIEAAKRKGQK
jgi:predicted ATPase